jgi:hypothetical protein
MSDKEKLERLADLEGYYNPSEMLEDFINESIVPAICMNEYCDSTYNYEPDSDDGYCEECKERSVVSCLVLAGLI